VENKSESKVASEAPSKDENSKNFILLKIK